MAATAKSPRVKALVAGNWKMNGLKASSRKEVQALGRRLAKGKRPACDVLICPPATLIAALKDAAKGTKIAIGGERVFHVGIDRLLAVIICFLEQLPLRIVDPQDRIQWRPHFPGDQFEPIPRPLFYRELKRIDVSTPAYLSEDGVAVGEKQDDAMRTLKDTKREPLDHVPNGIVLVRETSARPNALSYQFYDGKLMRIIAGDKRVIRYSEGCE